MNGVLKNFLIAVMIGVIAFCGYKAVQIQYGYNAEDVVHAGTMVYKPPVSSSDSAGDQTGAATADFENQSIVDLKTKYPDAIGWITIPYTAIDYPFVQAEDNGAYLDEDLDGNYALAGSIFLDYRNSKDFSDFNSILYGHHMQNETMFGALKEFNDKDFFNTNKYGTIFLSDKTYEIQFFAYLVVHVEDDVVFSIPNDEQSALAFQNYIKDNSRHYREISLDPKDRIVTLSTCAYEFANARMLLLGKITQIE